MEGYLQENGLINKVKYGIFQKEENKKSLIGGECRLCHSGVRYENLSGTYLKPIRNLSGTYAGGKGVGGRWYALT